MIHELFKTVLKVQLDISESLIALLPAPLRSQVKDLQDSVIGSIHDVTENYLKKHSDPKPDQSGLKKVQID